MNRLQAELQRLFLSQDGEREPVDPESLGLVGPDGRTRAMVLELAAPPSWELLSQVWRGVQADLQWPAPAIAVTGVDGYQLWFSLAEPIPAGQALALLESLRRRYLGEVGRERVRMTPSDASGTLHAQRIRAVPPVQGAPGRWSAFVAADLAALFADEPWLDLPPSPEAQADLLSRLRSIRPDDLARALEQLRSVAAAGFDVAGAGPSEGADTGPASARSVVAAPGRDPRHFLLEVMSDPAVELHLRIEAAKALLPYAERP